MQLWDKLNLNQLTCKSNNKDHLSEPNTTDRLSGNEIHSTSNLKGNRNVSQRSSSKKRRVLDCNGNGNLRLNININTLNNINNNQHNISLNNKSRKRKYRTEDVDRNSMHS